MKRLLHGATLAATVICHTPANAQTIYSCGQGTVRGAETLTEMVTPETITTRSGTDDSYVIEIKDGQLRRTFVVTVQLGDRLYMSQAAGASGTLDSASLEPGEPIDICVSRTEMLLERPDGSAYRASIGRSTPAPGLENACRPNAAKCANHTFQIPDS